MAAEDGAALRLDAGGEWQALRAADPAVFGAAWLERLAASQPGLIAAALHLRRPGGTLRPAARLPEAISPSTGIGAKLAAATEAAIARRSGVAREDEEALIAAYPVTGDDGVAAVVAVALSPGQAAEAALDGLRWAAGWLRSWLAQQRQDAAEPSLERARSAVALLSGTLDEDGFEAAALRATTELAQIARCDRVSLGLNRRGRSRIVAISNTARFGHKMAIVRQLADAMDEAIDQQSAILYPARDDGPPLVDRAHMTLVRSTAGAQALTVPVHARARFLGAFTFERMDDRPFTQAEIDLLAAAATLIGSLLEERRRADRGPLAVTLASLGKLMRQLFGRDHVVLKLATVALVALTVLGATVEGAYRVTGEAVLQGEIERSLTAPFDGFLIAAEAEPGDRVREGAVLARLDDRDLALEALRLRAERRRLTLSYERALAQRERAEANILSARVDQVAASLALVEGQVARAEIRAPFDAVVVAGDLSQAIGASVGRGDTLFRLAPLDAYRVMLWVDESQIDDLTDGALGTVVLSALPTERFGVALRRITPIAALREGRNGFRVEAALLGTPSARLRPGMSGVARLDAGERLLVAIWTRRAADWLRLQIWRWFG